MPPLTAYPDCLNTARSVNGEGRKAKAPTAPRAHLWSQFAGTFEGAVVTAERVKAHASQEHVAQGLTTWWKKVGNDEADSWAKTGAAMHGLSEANALEHKTLHTFAKVLSGFVARSAAEFVDKGWVDMDSLPEQGAFHGNPRAEDKCDLQISDSFGPDAFRRRR